MPQERDYILRMIAAAAAVARRLRERLAGGAAPEEVAREAREAQGELLGRDAALLRQLDPASAVALLGDDRRAEGWVALLRAEAEAQRAGGADADAALLDARADAIAAALVRRARPTPS